MIVTTTCPVTRKLSFASRREARRWMRHGRRAGGRPLSACQVYRCPHCGLWHMTSRKRQATAAGEGERHG